MAKRVSRIYLSQVVFSVLGGKIMEEILQVQDS